MSARFDERRSVSPAALARALALGINGLASDGFGGRTGHVPSDDREKAELLLQLAESLETVRDDRADVVRDVRRFSEKFALPLPVTAALPDGDLHRYRALFLAEEVQELNDAWHAGDTVKYLDALVDIVYVAVGTALLAGLPFTAAWHAVHAANMLKERAPAAGASKRGHALDVVKPAGWQPPEAAIAAALRRAGAQLSEVVENT